MSADTAYLALYLEAPLQSWGYQSKFDRRTTLSHPTRSGIVGMVCAAMGIDRADSAALAEFAEVEITVYSFGQHGRLVDFHTVGGGWDKRDSSQKRNVVPTADGKTGNTVITRREYLEDARFGVVLCGIRSQLEKIAAALRNPQWGVWLGRKACIPTAPVMQGVFETEADALEHLKQCAGGQGAPLRICRETASFDVGTDTLMDTPVNFATREFIPRRVAVE